MKSFEDKLAQVKEDIEREMVSGRENLSYLKGFLENDIPKLHERLQIEMQEREEQDSMIALKTSEELGKLQEEVNKGINTVDPKREEDERGSRGDSTCLDKRNH
eukprot:TRINITY_DN12108_c0_g1_i3.p3 TRINITY_DN12108_c0_g1~~TRINITY_DN12108_c0_g1_i3.p3  ORF type:complete len:104 (+),score=22.53 TRINITY_DN12108_c0_g1_i3:470-781(+)